ncbi:type IV pilus assembly protein PilY1 [Acinetobacter sp. BIGb0102]|uniref:pilus assembly protein PilY n=1 Tax=Acinetobacter sp. BIGb0102 TaxID=2485131 RepID=UPI000F4FD7E5|nr:pilus assembly protein PilY [Acinetobacter sp. BIGb0102]RPE29885.1 type IV pilus assembly protein PilY1 [Acinetobacter sp. BIGb0102]
MNNKKMKKLNRCEEQQKNKVKGLLLSCTVLSSLLILSSVSSASDIEIYQNPSNSNVIMLMVDVSQSMGTGPIADLQRDYPLCLQGGLLGGVKGLLGSAGVKVNADVLGLIKLNTTATTIDQAYCDIPSELVVNILETVNNTAGADLLGLKGSAQYIKDSCEPLKDATLEIIKGYRCYNRLARVKQAVRDVIDGNEAKGIGKLPDGVSVGLSVFPANALSSQGKNELAGMIAVEAKPLDDAQRKRIKDVINGVDSVDPVNNILTDVGNLVDKLLKLDLVGLVLGTLGTIPQLIDNLKALAGLSTPTATAYAETGAYLLGNTTKGTLSKSKEVGKIKKGGLLKSTTYYECDDKWLDGKCTDWIEAKDWYTNKEYDWVSDQGLLDRLLGGLLGGAEITFYKYDTSLDNNISSYSGFPVSIAASKNGNVYNAPVQTNASCSAKGIYVLTGSIPDLDPNLLDGLLGSSNVRESSTATEPVQKIMSRSINKDSNTAFNCGTVPTGWYSGSSSNKETWNCIANYAGVLKNNTHNIKTGVGGIGREFSHIPSAKTDLNTTQAPNSLLSSLLQPVANLVKALNPVLSLLGLGNLVDKLNKILDNVLPVPLDQNAHNKNIANLARWGVYGGGGWYQLSNSKSIAQSILDFNEGLITVTTEPVGLQTIPEDPLTPYRMSNDVYKSMFEPTEKASWIGNFKKYYVETDNSVNKLRDAWDISASSYDVQDWNKGGLLAKLKNLKNKTDNSDPTKPIITERKVLINRDCQQIDNTTTYQFTEVGALKSINNTYLNVKCGSGTTARSDDKGYLLMNLLGYNVGNAATTVDLTEANRTNWKVGMNLHSTPVKLTQEAVFNADNSVKERKDYMLFGTTQGLLHVIDAKTGEESFAFVPNEMLENTQQSKAFLEKPAGVKADMAYGIDGAWTIYSEYAYGMKAVSSGSVSSEIVATVGEIKSDGKVVAKGKQIAYGGLRMGGRSYYALDLSDISQPKLKFHIDPDRNRIISLQADGTYKTTTNTALAAMGQSWSKPTITSIMYKGAAKRVMIVGGGYDMEYEKTAPVISNATKGRMVYMFDADNGDLIWYAGGDNQSTSCGSGDTNHGMKMKDLYSVVSRINAVDRDGDGVTDHLYFGDLGGQVWRIDLSKDFGTKDGGCGSYSMLFKDTNSRFYEAPNFSVYGYEQPLAVISIASGNRSLPYSDKNSSSTVYNLFDQDVVRRNFSTASSSNSTPKLLATDLKAMLTASELKGKNLVQVKAMIPNGWYVQANSVVGKELDAQGNETALTSQTGSKVLGEMVVMNKSLYVSVYNPNTIAGNGCKIQANGATTVQRYCLPFGVCEQDVKDTTMSFGAGHGIVESMVGAGIGLGDKNGITRQLLNPNAKDKIGSSKLSTNTMRRQLVPLTWYERNE